MGVDRESFTPIYLQIEEDIRSQILSGKYREGDRLPSESELIKTYGVTRTTVQRALSGLVNEGMIERIHGKGSFVRLRAVRENIWNFSGFSTYAKKTNQIPITKVIEHEVYQEQSGKYLKLVRLRGFHKHNKNQWITLDTSILSLDIFPGLDKYDFSTLSLYETLKNEYKTEPDHARLSVKAMLANEQLMDIFELTTPMPLLNVQGNVMDQQGRTVEQVNVVYSKDADFNFVINI